MSRCIICITELLERFVFWIKRLDNFLGDCSNYCFVATMRLFCPDLTWSATLALNVIQLYSRVHEFLPRGCFVVSLVGKFLLLQPIR